MSNLRTWQPDPSRLVVECPPFHPAALTMCISIIVGLVCVQLVAKVAGQKLPSFALSAAVVPFVFVLWAILSGGSVAVLDTSHDDLAISRRILGISRAVQHYSISSLSAAQTRSGRGTRQLVFVLKNGTLVPFGPLTNQSGHAEAAEAINRYLSNQQGLQRN
jgi:hypothetical protein